MSEIDSPKADAETEIHAALKQCEDSNYAENSRQNLWEVMRRWILPENEERLIALNELCFACADENLKTEAQALITSLAAQWRREADWSAAQQLRVAIFEIAAEPPEYAPTLEFLFSLAHHPDTRWATFAAYENYPWRLRPHAQKYSGGAITDDDCEMWLISQGHFQDEVLMRKARDDREAYEIYGDVARKYWWD